MAKYLTDILKTGNTPQTQPMSGMNQVRNSAGGYVWALDPWQRLHRFLILGSEGGSYYATEQTLTIENANNVLACIQVDGLRAVREIVTLSQSGRAPKNDPAIFALALAASAGDDATRKAALDALPDVCRIGTHLFTFAEMVKTMRGWGRGLRKAVGRWYSVRDPRGLAYQLVKYRQRSGWTHTDTLRLAHVKPGNDTYDALYRWVTQRSTDDSREKSAWAYSVQPPQDDALAFVWAFEKVQQAQTVDEVLELVATYDLPREALPTQWLNDVAVWDALLQKMPMMAMIRNLGKMTKVGLIQPHSPAERIVVERLTDADRLQKARIHPISVLSAMRVYGLGYSLRGQNLWHYYPQPGREWTPTAKVLDALDTAFELAFHNVQPTGKRTMLALDVSGSMGVGMIAGVPGLTPREASAAMALVTMRKESDYSVMAFGDKLTPLDLSGKMRLDTVVKAISDLPFGGTDCALPMLHALKKKIPVDTFIVYTDSETWAGSVHPVEALNKYREKMGIPARLIVVAMVANGFSIADPNDAGMLDVVGFDSATPGLMADFARGEL